VTEPRIVVIEPGHPSLSGHFPGEPIAPAALLLDHAVSYVEEVVGGRVAAISTAKFLTPVRPGQAVVLKVRHGDDNWAVVTGSIDGTAAFSLSLALRRRDE
jgi:3-hydroxymyristoyl/3-hydroxydecanoyl-(acyl carrier protein) dehydratase